ncbi:hypothetical protein [Vreelandella maris]|uniref:hypothetical protein n=1 Tax=Vreelandella maris TaxID=2729617 RepID=UPI0030EE8A3E
MEPDLPELDNMVSGWMRRYGVASRCRPQAMSGMAPISPIDILTLCDKLRWPCDYDAAVTVLLAIDDTYRELHESKQQHQAA